MIRLGPFKKYLNEPIETQNVQIVPCKLRDGTKFYLVDTPGFDDTVRSDVDILRMISDWLSTAYQFQIQLTGIIYLHRILDPRVGGAALKNLKMFKKLCGRYGLGSVVLATTMWNQVPLATGQTREQDLQNHSDFWKKMIEQGSKVFRQDNGEESALRIVQYLIDKNRPVILQIQRDMVDDHLTLNETGAGKEVVTDYQIQAERYERKLDELREEIAEAIRDKDAETQKDLEELKAEQEAAILKHRQDLQRLHANKDEIRRQMEEQYAQEKAEMMKELEKLQESVRGDELQINSLKEAHQRELELQEARLKNSFYRAILARKCTIM